MPAVRCGSKVLDRPEFSAINGPQTIFLRVGGRRNGIQASLVADVMTSGCRWRTGHEC
jgi:hypothetical protein